MSESEVSYWVDDTEVCCFPSLKVPIIGEKIHINTEMDKDWYDARFNNNKLFHKGVRGDFKVISVNRFIKAYDTVVKQKFDDGKIFEFPSQKYIETFEVMLKKMSKNE